MPHPYSPSALTPSGPPPVAPPLAGRASQRLRALSWRGARPDWVHTLSGRHHSQGRGRNPTPRVTIRTLGLSGQTSAPGDAARRGLGPGWQSRLSSARAPVSPAEREAGTCQTKPAFRALNCRENPPLLLRCGGGAGESRGAPLKCWFPARLRTGTEEPSLPASARAGEGSQPAAPSPQRDHQKTHSAPAAPPARARSFPAFP